MSVEGLERLTIERGRIMAPYTGWISPFEERFRSMGPKVCRFIEQNCVHGEGDFSGEPFHLAWWQRDLINRLFALVWDEEQQRWRRRFRKALIGFPKGNGKTELIAALALAMLCGRFTKSPLIPVAAASKEQANILFGSAKDMCQSPTLKRVTEAGSQIISLRGGEAGRLYRVAAAEGTNDGQRPSLYIADEYHEFAETKNVDKILANGTAKRKDALELKITTAGPDLDTLCGRLYQHGVKVATGELTDPEFFFYWLEPPEGVDPSDEQVWRRVNPAADDFWPFANLRKRLDDLMTDNPPEIAWATFQRYFLNRWVELVEGAWLPPGMVDACEEPGVTFDPLLPVHLGWDASTRYDSTAIVAVQRRVWNDIERVVVAAWLWERPVDVRTGKLVEDWLVPIEEAVAKVWELARAYKVAAIQFDPAFITWEAGKMSLAGLPMAEFNQNSGKLIEASQALYRAVKLGAAVPAGGTDDGGLAFDPAGEGAKWARHMKSAAAQQLSKGNAAWRLVKGKAKKPMDAAVATAMAIWSLEHPAPEPEKKKGPNLWGDFDEAPAA